MKRPVRDLTRVPDDEQVGRVRRAVVTYAAQPAVQPAARETVALSSRRRESRPGERRTGTHDGVRLARGPSSAFA